MNQSILKAQNLSVKFGNFFAIEDVSIEINKNEVCYIIGPNGSGKSTLIKSLLLLQPISSGKITLLNEPASKANVAKYCSYVPQYLEVERDFPISVEEIVDLHLNKKRDLKELKHFLDLFKIHFVMNKTLNELSGGQIQRLFIVLALIKKPTVLFLDEPTNNLDPEISEKFYDLLSLLKKKMSIVVVSHDISIVSKTADKVICINKKVGCVGKPKDVLNQDVLEKVYYSNLAFHKH